MAAFDGTSLKQAVQAIIARTGLYWVAVIGVSWAYVQLGPSGEFWIAIVLYAAGLWLVLFGMKDKTDFRAIERLKNGTPPRDGQWVAIAGKAVPLPPDDGGPILACRFKSYDRMSGSGDRRSNLRLRYDAYYLRPCGIDTGDTVVALKGFPDLIHTDKKPLDNDLLVAAKAAARKVSRAIPPPVLRELTIAGPVTEIEACYEYGHPEHSGDGKIDSYALETGEEVCAFGYWRDGALWKSYRRARGVPLYKGGIAAVHEELRDTSKGFTIFGYAVLALAAGLAAWSLI